MMDLTFPGNTAYKKALQKPEFAFSAASGLRDFEIQSRGVTLHFASGNFAIAFKSKAPRTGSFYALKCFTRAGEQRQEHYREISHYLQQKSLDAMVGFEYVEKAVRVFEKPDQFLPLVKMEWVDGVPFKDWIQKKCELEDRAAFAALARKWEQLVKDLRAHRVAHGDLQHGNILVSPRDDFYLVDYDGMGVPALFGREAPELGLPGYQHPERIREGAQLGIDLDNFSSNVIYVSLKALSWDPSLFTRFNNEHGLIISELDLKAPRDSEIFQILRASVDADLAAWATKLAELATQRLSDVPHLEVFLNRFGQIEERLDAHDYDEAVALAIQIQSPLPADLKMRVEDARKRVELRGELEQAISAGDEQRLANLFNAKLLDDYPQAERVKAIASLSAQVAPVVDGIRSHVSAGRIAQAIAEWDRNSPLLSGRRSGELLRPEIERWRERQRCYEKLAKLLQRADKEIIQEIPSLHRDLEGLGGHPEAASRDSEIRRKIQQVDLALRLKGYSEPATFEQDERYEQAWDEDLLANWPPAVRFQKAIQEVRERLRLFRPVRLLVENRAAQSIADEQKITDVLSQLTESYVPEAQERSKLARKRIRNIADTVKLLNLNASEKELSEQYGKLGKDHLLLEKSQQERLKLAARRDEVLDEILNVTSGKCSLENDRQLVEIWDETLLRDCETAERYHMDLEQAKARLDSFGKLQSAVAQKDDLKITQLASSEILKAYELPRELRGSIQNARASTKKSIAILAALNANDESAFAAQFEIDLLNRNWGQFEAQQAKIQQWLCNGLLRVDQIGLKPPLAKATLTSNELGFEIRWRWPTRFCEKCLVAISRAQFSHGDRIDENLFVANQKISKQEYEERGCCFLSTLQPISNARVFVWAIVEIGGREFFSEPLFLGRI